MTIGGRLRPLPVGGGLVRAVGNYWLQTDFLFIHHAHLFARLDRIGVPICLSELIHLLLAWLSV